MALQTSDSLLVRVFAGSPVGMAIYDSSGECLSVNDSAPRLIGATRQEMLSQNFRSLGSWERSGLLEDAERTLATGETTERSVGLRSTFGKDVWLTYRFSRFDSEGLQHLLLVFSDDTASKEVEARLRESAERFDAIMRESGDLIYRVRLVPEPVFEYVSSSSREFTGMTPEQCRAEPGAALAALFPDGTGVLDGLPDRGVGDGGDSGKGGDGGDGSAGAGELPAIVTLRRLPDGREVRAEHHVRVSRDESGRITAVEGIARDLTERLAAAEAVAESERRYSSLFNDSHAIQLIIDPADGAIVDVNPAACNFYGRSRDAFLRMNITDVNVLSAAEVKAEMAAALAELRDHFHFRHRLSTGEIRDVEVYSSPATINGRPLLYSIVHDVTARRRAEEAVRQLAEESSLLLEATEVMTASLHLDEMLSRLSGVAAGLVGARRCTISLQGEDGLWRDVASTDKSLTMPGESFDPALPSMETVLFVEDVKHVDDIGFSPHPGMLSALIAPFSRAGVSGWLCFDDPGWSTLFSAEQRRLAAAIAKQAALALANSQAFETQLSIAAVLQRNLMPQPVDDMCGLEIAYRYVSATKGALVGGDFLDYMALDDDRVLLFLGDVSGHGLEATIHTAMAKYAVKALASIDSRPSMLLAAVNRAIVGQMGRGQFITMTMVLIDTARMHACAASAGHPSPLVLRGTDLEPSVVRLTEDAQNGPPLGALESSEYVEVCTALSYGDKVVAFTDGATEARSAADRNRMLGRTGVQMALMESAGGSALATASGLLASVEKFAGGALTDDLAIVTARLLPREGAA